MQEQVAKQMQEIDQLVEQIHTLKDKMHRLKVHDHTNDICCMFFGVKNHMILTCSHMPMHIYIVQE
jgi:hypothetical protein